MQKSIKNFIAFSVGLFALFGVANFSYAAGLDMISTPATSISQTSATLGASFTNTFPSADVRFEWGIVSGVYPYSTSYVVKPGASGTHSDTITGLTPGVTYYFRAMGVSNGGPEYGNELSFTTLTYKMPKVINVPASNIGSTDATLSGAFDGQGLSTTTWFEYANNSSMIGASSTASVLQSNTFGNINQAISGLTPNTKYYFRFVAKTNGGIVYGTPVLSFTTNANGGGSGSTNCSINYFNVNTNTIVAGNSATLSWNTTNCLSTTLSSVGTAANTNGSYTITPSTTTTYVLTSTNGLTTDSKNLTVTVLAQGNNGGSGNGNSGYGYYYYTTNTNCSGGNTILGGFWSPDYSCYTTYYQYPQASSTSYSYPNTNYGYYPYNNYNNTNNGYNNQANNVPIQTVKAVSSSVSDVSAETAVLSGSVYKNVNRDVVGYFEYGTTANLGMATSRQTVYTSGQKLISGIPSLLPDTTYYFRMVAEDGSVSSRGDILYFKTRKVGEAKAASVVTGTIKNSNNGSGGNTNTSVMNSAAQANPIPSLDNSMNSNESSLAASAGFLGGFLPGTFIGWLLLFILILIIIITARSFSRKENHHVAAH